MYTPSKNFETPQEQEIVCLLTGESYVFLEGNDMSLVDSKYHAGALDALPRRFFTTPWIIRNSQGQVRVFGSIE